MPASSVGAAGRVTALFRLSLAGRARGGRSATALPSCAAVARSLANPGAGAPDPAAPDAVPVLGGGAAMLVLYFTKSSCPHCKALTPVLAERLAALAAADPAAAASLAGVVVCAWAPCTLFACSQHF